MCALVLSSRYRYAGKLEHEDSLILVRCNLPCLFSNRHLTTAVAAATDEAMKMREELEALLESLAVEAAEPGLSPGPWLPTPVHTSAVGELLPWHITE